MTFQQSVLPDALIGRPPRELWDTIEGEVFYLHPSTLYAEIYRRPKIDWGGHLVGRLITGGVEIDVRGIGQYRIIPSDVGSEHFQRIGKYLR
jgi:hypothetical protein